VRYFVFPDSRDGCDIPTQPEPVELENVGAHIAIWLDRFHQQGYFSNARQERIPLDRLSFRLEPEDSHGFLEVLEALR
jgi:hypothetical protein